jgi:hypothetical protein
VLDDNDGTAPDGLSGVLYRVEILLGTSMDARISVDGQARDVKDICIEDLLAVADEAEKMIPKRRRWTNLARRRAAPLFTPAHVR